MKRRHVPIDGENVEEEIPVHPEGEETGGAGETRHGAPLKLDEALHDFMEDQEEHMRLREVLRARAKREPGD